MIDLGCESWNSYNISCGPTVVYIDMMIERESIWPLAEI